VSNAVSHSRRHRASAVLLPLAIAVVLAGCRGDESLTGNWTGAFKDSLGLAGGGHLTISQSGASLSGEWQVTFTADSAFNDEGPLTGTAAGDTISATLMPTRGPCPFALTATRTGDQIRGNYTAVNCRREQTGTVDLQRR
jgi:hypothetical protein